MTDQSNEKTVSNPDDPLSSAEWESRYQTGKTGWDRGKPSPQFTAWFLENNHPNLRILVPGCGRGHEVIELVQAGHDVVAIDFADSAVMSLKKSRAKLGKHFEIIQENVLEFSASEPFDAIYEQTCLCALEPMNWERYVSQLYSWLKPGGTIYAMFMQTKSTSGPPFHCDLTHMQELFGEDHWIWETVSSAVDHPSGLHEIPCVLKRK